MSQVVDRIFSSVPNYGSIISTIKKAPGSDELPEISCFDFLLLESTTIPYSLLTDDEKVGVASDERTIIFHFPSGYVCVDQETLVKFATNENAKFYECTSSEDIAAENDSVGSSFIKLPLGPGGGYFSVFTKNFLEFLASGDRIVSIISIIDSTVERTISEDALKNLSEDSYVSSNHCQKGSSLDISYLEKTEIEGVPSIGKYPSVEIVDRVEEYVDLTGIINVTFGEDFDNSVSRVDWKDVETVQFGDRFDHSVSDVDWKDVWSVTFGNHFDQVISDVRWKNVEYVEFGFAFDQPINMVDWMGIRTVVFGHHFDHTLTGVDWKNVEIIELGYSFNQPIKDVEWGDATSSVSFGRRFDHSLTGVNWKNVRNVTLSSRYSKSIDSLTGMVVTRV